MDPKNQSSRKGGIAHSAPGCDDTPAKTWEVRQERMLLLANGPVADARTSQPFGRLRSLRYLWAVNLLLVMTSMACRADSEASAVPSSVVNLGSIAPGASGVVYCSLPESLANANLEKVALSCGCLSGSQVLSDDRAIEIKETIPPGNVRVKVVIEPGKVGRFGARSDQIRVDSVKSQVRQSHIVHLKYDVSNEASAIANYADLSSEMTLPSKGMKATLRLSKPKQKGNIQIEPLEWCSATFSSQEGMPETEISIDIAPIHVAGLYELPISIATKDGWREHVRFRVSATPPSAHSLSPSRLSLGLPVHGSVSTPVHVRAPGANGITIQCQPDSAHVASLTISGVVTSDVDETGRRRLAINVEGGAQPGFFQGRLIVSLDGAGFSLTLPYSVRVN